MFYFLDTPCAILIGSTEKELRTPKLMVTSRQRRLLLKKMKEKRNFFILLISNIYGLRQIQINNARLMKVFSHSGLAPM